MTSDFGAEEVYKGPPVLMLRKHSKGGEENLLLPWGEPLPRPSMRPTTAQRRVTLAIAARPTLFGEVLARQLGGEDGLQVIGLARDEDQMLQLLKARGPRVLLLDYEGVRPNVENLIVRLRRAATGTRILVLANESNQDAVERVLHAGGSGLVDKQLDLATLVRAIRTVAAGELWANRRAIALTLEHIAEASTHIAEWDGKLTTREWQITESVGQGLRNKEIARRLNISEKTVKSHLNNIFRKLQVDNRFAVGLYALDIKAQA